MLPQTGTVVEFLPFPAITREQLKAYAEASGDFNPIHLDEEVAKNMGLPGIIAHGMLIAGLMAERAQRYISQEVSLREYEIVHFQSKFKAMTLLGDIPSVGGVVKEATDESFVLDLQTKNQRGELTTVATVKYRKK